MPYIITTKNTIAARKLLSGDKILHRCAVATFDEVRDSVTAMFEDELSHKITARVGGDLSVMDSLGGLIGPLPDGTLIEVEPLTEFQLWSRVTGQTSTDDWFQYRSKNEELIAAFNEQQAGRKA